MGVMILKIIGIGCDIVEIARIRQALEQPKFLRFLTKREQEIFHRLQGQRQLEWAAGRFAAKEAIYKAVSARIPCVLSKIEVLSDEKGAPICHMEAVDIQLSIAHEQQYAIAYAMALEKE